MVYVGCPGSSTVLHIEPGQFCSMNTLLRGRKAWRIIPERFMEKFISLYKSFGLSTCGHASCVPGNLCKICSCDRAGAHSPVFFATSEFLNAHGILHYDFIQYPGDTVYVNSGVGHAIVNLDFCVAEARTLLPTIIGANRDETHCCECSKLGRQRIGLSNPGLFIEVVTKNRCPYRECCNGLLMSDKEFHDHMREHGAYKCATCAKDFANKENLTRHQADVHENKSITCYPCRDSNLKRISKSRHQQQKNHLLKCKSFFSDRLPFISDSSTDNLPARKTLAKLLGK